MPPPNFHEHIQVDTSDEDSLYDAESIADSNMSFASSVRDYYYENGRRYHAYRYGQYPIPNDEEEQDRLAITHHLFKLLIGGDLYRTPLLQQGSPKRILDIGTGTGIWALEVAEEFPEAEIIGTDLSPIQPNFSPPNCTFIIDDAESDWAFTKDEAFDFIHSRSMGGGIADWQRLLQQAYNHLKPGGWIEFQEYEATIHSDDGTHVKAPMLLDLAATLDEASQKFGKRVNVAPSLSEWLEAAGFTNVTVDIYKCPVGSWAKSPRLKEIGRVGRVSLTEAIEPYSLALFTRVLGWSFERAQDYVDKCRQEAMNSSCHIYVLFYYVYAQRPVNDS
ncbi:S-adenosyl-L-methionine-dependent methyltransferase [Aspergillus pseudodeflectus]|uniref:S-adenosyl-L-methionine-dependent methyltransferase n=1 Tax=Aspergillus pseudodeflectus TaxID=176178 RepID=A0ABR4KQH3_9EURO